jgi:hypothetical protein
MKPTSLRQMMVGVALTVAGGLAGASVSTSNVAHGEVRGTPPPVAFQSGGQLSVPILQEIAATLHQMDARLARLETVAQKLQATRKTN